MDFLKRFLINLAVLIGLGILLLILFPDLMRQVYQLFGGLFAPAVILLLILVAALPRKGRRKGR